MSESLGLWPQRQKIFRGLWPKDTKSTFPPNSAPEI